MIEMALQEMKDHLVFEALTCAFMQFVTRNGVHPTHLVVSPDVKTKMFAAARTKCVYYDDSGESEVSRFMDCEVSVIEGSVDGYARFTWSGR